MLHHLIILQSLGCLTFSPGLRQYRWLEATNFCSFGSGQESRLETHHAILVIPIPLSGDNQWLILWLRRTLLYSKPHGTVRFMLEHCGLKQ